MSEEVGQVVRGKGGGYQKNVRLRGQGNEDKRGKALKQGQDTRMCGIDRGRLHDQHRCGSECDMIGMCEASVANTKSGKSSFPVSKLNWTDLVLGYVVYWWKDQARKPASG